MEICTNLNEVALAVTGDLIGIDGMDGTGKSTLARELGTKIDAPVVELDGFLNKNQDCFVESLRFKELEEAISQHVGIVIVEGVCLLNVAKILGLELSTAIYVKRISAMGNWQHQDECSVPLDKVESYLDNWRQTLVEFEQLTGNDEPPEVPGLFCELVKYHAMYQPQDDADVVFHRVDA